MKLQNYAILSERIRAEFIRLKQTQPERFEKRLNISWSNWGFGMEPLEVSARRLRQAGVRYIELHGNHYGPDIGYNLKRVLDIMGEHDIQVSGVCGMFSEDNDLSSNKPRQRQAAIDYLKREIEFTAEAGGSYLLVVPGAVGRPKAYDLTEFERSVETLRQVADLFVQAQVKAAIEPIRRAEVSFCHTIKDAVDYITAVGHPGVAHINGDVYHMQMEESHIGQAIIDAGNRLLNLHLADSHRGALGQGSMDIDTIIMALYLIGHNAEGRYVTPEPLGPGGDPYPAMYGKPGGEVLDKLVFQTVDYFREREDILLAM